MSDKTTLGNVEVVLYAGLRGATPTEVGTLRIPLTLRSVSTGTIEAQLSESLEYVSESLRAVFGATSEGATS